MRVLIIGAGFIGLNFIRSKHSNDIKITVLDRNECPEDVREKVNWIVGDFYSEINLDNIVKDVDIIFYFISNTFPNDNLDQTLEVSLITKYTLNLLDLCVTNKIKRLIFTSSASVYGNQKYQPIFESATTDPISFHGIFKLMIEKYLEYYRYHYKLDYKVLRISNPFGPGQNISSGQGFIANLIGCILSNKDIVIYGDGSAVRDFIYIDDVSLALKLSIETNSKLNIFNVSSGTGYALADVIAKVEHYIKNPVLYRNEASKPTDIYASILDTSAARNFLGFNCKFSFDDGLLLTLKYHKIKVEE